MRPLPLHVGQGCDGAEENHYLKQAYLLYLFHLWEQHPIHEFIDHLHSVPNYIQIFKLEYNVLFLEALTFDIAYDNE